MNPLTEILIVVLALVLLVGLALRVRTVLREQRLFQGGRVVVRCREGHLFTTTWIAGVSVKAIRFGATRYQWCPVGQHRTLVTRVPPEELTDLQRRQAEFFDDGGVP